MPDFVVSYVRLVDYFSTKLGRLAMYLIFMMIGVLLLGAFTRNIINVPLSWTIEMAQFTMAAYYIMGGAYSMQLNDHVRMDLVYDRCSDKGKAKIDSVTNFFLIFYLVCLLFGSISSTIYAIETGQRKFSMWNPSMIPIKIIMVTGIVLMLLQSIAIWIKDIARWRDLAMPGVDLSIARGADAMAQHSAIADQASIENPSHKRDTS